MYMLSSSSPMPSSSRCDAPVKQKFYLKVANPSNIAPQAFLPRKSSAKGSGVPLSPEGSPFDIAVCVLVCSGCPE